VLPHAAGWSCGREDYARAIFRTWFKITADEIEERVAARLRRQLALTRDDPAALWVILDEWVLRRPVGGRHVMQEQVGRLIDAARQPHIAIGILPAATGAHDPATGGLFRPVGGGGEVMDSNHDLSWRKASYSGSNGGGCVEVASGPGTVAVRDSKDPDGPRLASTAGDWRAFLRQVKDGQLA
jgi:hypothetical protein